MHGVANRVGEYVAMCRAITGLIMTVLSITIVLSAVAQDGGLVVWTPVSEFGDPNKAVDFYIKRRVEEHLGVPIDDLVSRFDDEKMVRHLKSMLTGAEDDARYIIVQTMTGIARRSLDDPLRQDVVFDTLVNVLDDPTRYSELSLLSSFRGGGNTGTDSR